MHPCQYFTHLWHFAFGLVLGHSNYNNTLFQWGFFGGTPCTGCIKKRGPLEIKHIVKI